MALWQAVSFLLAALSLVFPLAATLNGSGKGIESGREYLVAPELADCPVNTNCSTLSSYSIMGTAGLCDVTFSFLPGIHSLSQTWSITASSNIIIRGAGNSEEEDNESSYKVEITCDSNFSGSQAIQVNNSKQVVIEGIRIADCYTSLSLETSNDTNVRNLSIICSFSLPHQTYGLAASNCEGIVFKHSTVTNCFAGIYLENIQSGIIDDVLSISNNYGLYLSGSLELEVSKSNFSNNYIYNIVAVILQGDVTFKQVFAQGSSIPIYMYVLASDEATSIRVNIFDTTVRMERESVAAIDLFAGLQNMDINLQSVSVIGNPLSGFDGILIVYDRDAGSLAESASVRIDNVTIENINSDLPLQEAELSAAALSVLSSTNLTISNCTIKNNGVTGISLYDSTALLQGNIILTNNSGINGGGMSLISKSFIVLDSSTNLQLSHNTAEQFGGGIYVSQDLLWLPPVDGADYDLFTYCFALSIDGSSKHVVFDGNRANGSGQNLYGGYLQDCILPTYNNQSVTKGISISDDQVSTDCNQTIISSDPIKLLPCNEYCVNDSKSSTKQYISALFPGQDFSLRIAAVGQQNGLTPAVILFSSYDIILDETSPGTTQSFDTQRIDAQCTTLTQTLALKEYVDEAVVNITIADETLPSFVNTPIKVYVEIKPCPPGFNLSNGICVCTNSIHYLATCNITSESIQRNGNSWIYPRNDSIMIFNNCPFDYCNNIAFHSDNPDDQCDHNRSGILCGECINDFSLVLGSNKCHNCEDEVWQLPLIVLGSALAGIGLVVVLIAINLTVSVGTMNGLLFFVNVVKIYEPFFVVHPKLHYFIYWLNLDLGITSCFLPGMTACVKVGLQFVFPLYLMSIVAFIVVICKAGQWPVLSSSRFMRFVSGKMTLLIGSKAIPVLATLLLLSYTKLLRTTILVFHKATVNTTNCEENTSLYTNCKNFDVWYVDGNINFTSNYYRVLLSVAVTIILPLVVFTAFLLFFPLMERYLPRFECWSSQHMRLKPWYDAYGGPYNDDYRWWTGMLLFVRCVLALVAAFENDPLVNLSVLSWICLLLILFLSLFQVYKNFLLSALELLYLVSLLLMIFFSSAESQQIYVVLSVVLCAFPIIISYHVYHEVVKLKRIQRLVDKAKRKIKKFRNNFREEINHHNCDANDSTVSSTLVTMKIVDSTELREPLLQQEL